jgi:predicted transposase/invertase (TIGR01784 family)
MSDDPWSEPVGIIPRVDCVFKAILGDPRRISTLLDFLRAILAPAIDVASVELRQPTRLPEHLRDDALTVDVSAVDLDGRIYQIEMQTLNHGALKERMLYTWASLYKSQLGKNDSYNLLRPVLSIWLLDENTLTSRRAPGFHHRFGVYDPADHVRLTEHLEIHTLELAKWRSHRGEAAPAVEGWMAFFAEAETWSELPEAFRRPPLEDAMSVLKDFKTNAALNDVYRARMDFLRREMTQREDVEQARAERERALAERDEALARADVERARAEAERAEKDRFRELLRKAGIDPDA